MKTLLVYYSRRGIAKKIATDYLNHVNTDVVEIKVKKKYTGPFGYYKSRRDALRKKYPDIIYDEIDFKKYERIIICGAIWSNSICSPIKTFLKQNRGKLNNVEYLAIAKNNSNDFSHVFDGMDYEANTHFKRATAITVRFRRIVGIKRY